MLLLFSVKRKPLLFSGLITLVLILSCTYHVSHAQNASKLTVSDTRSTATLPSTYFRGVTADFKTYSIMTLPNTSAFYTVLGINGWGDDTGGPSHELAFSNTNDVYIRTGFISSGWGTWEKILTDHSIKTLSNGNVLIGKKSQTNSSYKLDVNGSIRANKMVVNSTGADFVFDSSYHLMSLDSLSRYIKAYHHLPGIPSAKEMQSNGADLGELYNKMLEKMEILTEYVIEQCLSPLKDWTKIVKQFSHSKFRNNENETSIWF